ncbi:MAG: hypothetical protein AB7F36_01220 [Reyranellaceae bacterium]
MMEDADAAEREMALLAAWLRLSDLHEKFPAVFRDGFARSQAKSRTNPNNCPPDTEPAHGFFPTRRP